MYIFSLKEGGHDWEKQNLVTQQDRGGMFDLLKCRGCGLSGKVRNLTAIELPASTNEDKLRVCPAVRRKPIPTKIRVLHCNAVGKRFENLKDGSEHETVVPPIGYENDGLGVWVMGNGEKVKLLRGEYEALEFPKKAVPLEEEDFFGALKLKLKK